VNRVPDPVDHVATHTETIIAYILIEVLGVFCVHSVVPVFYVLKAVVQNIPKHYRPVQLSVEKLFILILI